MCRALRKIDRRRRSVATGRRRLRRVRLARRSLRTSVFMLMMSSSATRRGLAGLEAHVFTCVPDAFAVVRVGRADGPDVGCDLAHGLLVDAADGDLGRFRRVDGDSGGRLDDDGMREAEAELEVLAFHLAAEADALDLEVLDEPFRDTGDRVGDQRSRQPVLGPLAAAVAVAAYAHDAAVDLDAEPRVDLHLQGALRPLDVDEAFGVRLRFDALRHVDRGPTDARHHHTSQMISPPTLPLRASRSARSPRDVEMMATPSPPRTTGTCCAFAYARRPGVET